MTEKGGDITFLDMKKERRATPITTKVDIML